MKRWISWLLICSFYYPIIAVSVLADPPPQADITLTLTATANQIIGNYNAPNGSACTSFEVSESGSYSPLVDDANPSLFTQTGRELGVGGTPRQWIVGQMPYDGVVYPGLGSDGLFHSLALTPNTLYHARITCGSHTGEATITTKNLQLGSTRAVSEPIAAAGQLGWPTLNYDAGVQQTLGDPTTGLKMFHFIPARGTISEPVTTKAVFGSTALGTNWTTPNNALVDDTNNAVYTGTTQDWLALKLANFNISNQYFLYAVKLWVKGEATGTGDNAVLQTCISKDGTTCFSDLQEIALVSTANTEHCYPNNGTSTTCTNEPATYNTWKSRSGGRPLVAADLSSCSTCYIFVRKKGTGAGTINVQYAAWDFIVDYLPALYDNGAQMAWSRTTVNDSSSTAGYLLQTRQLGLSNLLWWVNTSAMTARFLGDTYIPADATFSRNYVNSFTSSFSDSDPTVYYGIGTDAASKTIGIKGQLPATGNPYYDTAKAKDTHATVTWSVLRADLNAAMHTFNTNFVAADYNCGFSTVQRGHLFARCFRGNQDSIAWVVGINVSTGNIDSQIFTDGLPGCEWCGYHTEEESSQDAQYFSFVLSDLHNGSSLGGGPYTTTTTSVLNGTGGAGCGGVVTKGCVDTFTLATDTPTAPLAPTTLHPIHVGNVLRFDEGTANEEQVQVTAVSGLNFSAVRGFGSYSPSAHSSGAAVRAVCAQSNPDVGAEIYWNFTGDPTGAAIVKDTGNLSQAHRGMARRPSSNAAWGVSASGWWTKDVTDETTAPATGTERSVTRSPIFGGISDSAHGLTRCDGNNCQSHPEPPHNFGASLAERTVAFDILPHVGDLGFNPSGCTNVTGQLYVCTPSLALNRKVMPTLVMFGTKPGLDISSPTTGNVMDGSGTYSYKYCVPEHVNECRTGSTVGQVYVNAPAIDGTTFFSPGGESTSFAQFTETQLGIGPRNSWVNSFVQLKLDSNDSTGVNTRALSYGLFTPMRRQSITASTKISPDGKMILLPMVPDQGREFDMALAFMPSLPSSDSVDRTNLVQTPITVGAVGGATEAYIEFGLNSNFYCTSRKEKCISAASNAPYFFAAEAFSAVSCAAGCTINIATFPNTVIKYRVIWRDSGHGIVQTGATQAIVDSGSGGSPPPVSGGGSTMGGKITISGKVTIH